MHFFRPIARKLDGLRISNSRDRLAEAIRTERRARDIARKAGWETEAKFCQFRAQCLMLHTYYKP